MDKTSEILITIYSNNNSSNDIALSLADKDSDRGINNHLNKNDYLKHNPPRVKYKYIQIKIQLIQLITMHTITTSQNNQISQNT